MVRRGFIVFLVVLLCSVSAGLAPAPTEASTNPVLQIIFTGICAFITQPDGSYHVLLPRSDTHYPHQSFLMVPIDDIRKPPSPPARHCDICNPIVFDSVSYVAYFLSNENISIKASDNNEFILSDKLVKDETPVDLKKCPSTQTKSSLLWVVHLNSLCEYPNVRKAAETNPADVTTRFDFSRGYMQAYAPNQTAFWEFNPGKGFLGPPVSQFLSQGVVLDWKVRSTPLETKSQTIDNHKSDKLPIYFDSPSGPPWIFGNVAIEYLNELRKAGVFPPPPKVGTTDQHFRLYYGIKTFHIGSVHVPTKKDSSCSHPEPIQDMGSSLSIVRRMIHGPNCPPMFF